MQVSDEIHGQEIIGVAIYIFHLFICLFVCLFVCLSIYLFIYLSIYLFIYLFYSFYKHNHTLSRKKTLTGVQVITTASQVQSIGYRWQANLSCP